MVKSARYYHLVLSLLFFVLSCHCAHEVAFPYLQYLGRVSYGRNLMVNYNLHGELCVGTKKFVYFSTPQIQQEKALGCI